MLGAIFITLVIVLLIGVRLVVRGLVGGRIDDHPICRRCGFDLVGYPNAANCAECGAELKAAGAIRRGHRKRDRMALASGLIICTPVVLLFAIVIGASLLKVNWNSYKPLWLLRTEATSLSAVRSDAALFELLSRLRTPSLSDEQISTVTESALAMQADRSRPWNEKWGDFLERSRAMGKLTDEQWERYGSQAPDFQIMFRPRVRRGDRLAYRTREGPSRVGSTSSSPLIGRVTNGVINIGGHEIRDNDVIGTRFLQTTNNGVAGGGFFELRPIFDKLVDGPQQVTISGDVETFADWDVKKKPIGKRPIKFTGTFTLVPASQPTVEVVNDESLRAEFAAKVAVKRISVKQGSLYTEYSVGGPIPLAHEIVMREPGKFEETLIGGCVWSPSSNVRGYGDYSEFSPPLPAVVDVIFRPNPDYAIGTVDIFKMWGGEMVFRNVPIQPPPAATRSAPP
jgi:hypothetical protein